MCSLVFVQSYPTMLPLVEITHPLSIPYYFQRFSALVTITSQISRILLALLVFSPCGVLLGFCVFCGTAFALQPQSLF
jgi:hypothetical protein